MATVYNPVATEITTITCPDDGDLRNVASVNLPMKKLADAALKHKQDIAALTVKAAAPPALSFHPPVKITGSRITRVKYDRYTRKWMACGPAVSNRPSFVRSEDPLQWAQAVTEIADTSFPTAAPCDFAVGPTGKIILCDSVIDAAWVYNAGVWATSFTGNWGDDPTTPPHIVYEPVTGNWVVAFYNAGLPGIIIATTPDGVTWTNRTQPTGVSATCIGIGMETDGLGNIWMVLYDSLGFVGFSKSTNGGVAWSAVQSVAITTGGAGMGATSDGSFPKPAWNGTTWAAVVPNSSANKCTVLKLTGSTWGITTAFNATLAINGIAGHPDGQWAGITCASAFAPDNYRVVVSADLTTWQYSDYAPVVPAGFFARGANIHCNELRFAIAGRGSAGTDTDVFVSGGLGTGRTIPTS